MEYTVGSIADLISGKNTPNKPKVKKLKLEQPTSEVANPEFEQQEEKPSKKSQQVKTNKKNKHKISPSSGDSNIVVINPELFKNKLKTEKAENAPDALLSEDSTKTKKSKKRKRDKSEEISLPKEETEDASNSVSDSNEATLAKPEKRKKKKNKTAEKSMDTEEDKKARTERDARTVFVGNVPVTIKKRQLLRLFAKYGHVESVRLRCVAPAEPGIPKRVAFIKKLMHPKRLTMHSYVTFTLREDALKALAANGTKYKDHHLRVQISNDNEKPDPRKAIFIGNLPFDIEDEELWNVFEPCGSITSVRIIRDAKTNMGIGVAYVNFDSPDAVELALQMHNVTIKNKALRIHRYSQKKKHGQRHQTERGNNTESKYKKGFNRPKHYPGGATSVENSELKTTKIPVKNSIFQGSKSNLKKKHPKLNKSVINKMKLSKKIAPK